MSNRIFILSTKYIDQSFVWNSTNKKERSIYDIRSDKKNQISLISFYNDIGTSSPFFNEKTAYSNQIFEIIDDIFNDETKKENIEKIYQLNLNNDIVFLTYSYPFTLEINFGSNGDDWYYWLVAYFEDICKLLDLSKNNLEKYEFVFILHDKDVGLSDLITEFDLIKLKKSINEDFLKFFQDSLLNSLLEEHSKQIVMQYCYPHDDNKIHKIIQNFNPQNGGDLLEVLEKAASNYTRIKRK